MLFSIVELSTNPSNSVAKKSFKGPLLGFLNEESIPIFLKRDLLIYYMKNYYEFKDLEDLQFKRLIHKTEAYASITQLLLQRTREKPRPRPHQPLVFESRQNRQQRLHL